MDLGQCHECGRNIVEWLEMLKDTRACDGFLGRDDLPGNMRTCGASVNKRKKTTTQSQI